MTHRTVRCLAMSLALVSWSPLAFAQSSAINSTSSSAPAGMAAPAAGVSAQDKLFVQKAGEAGLAEVQDGQLAVQKGSSKAVQDAGQAMVTGHGKANSQLQSLAQNAGITVPTAPSAAQQAQYSALQGMSGAGFDSSYLAGQRKAHEAAIKLFKKEAQSGTNPALKSFAHDTLPTLRRHLRMFEQAHS